MIEVSENLRSQINTDSRTFRARILNGEEMYEEILSLKKSVVFPSSSMSIGNALCACVECTASDIPVSITGAKMQAEITIFESEDFESEEWIRLGTFTAEKPTVQDGNISFTAYDDMAKAANVPYKSTLDEGVHTAGEYFVDICSVLGVECFPLDEALASLEISEDKLSGYSCRDALAYLAGYLGRNCIVNRDGLFEMVSFRTIDYDMLNADRISEPELSDSDCAIGYIACCVDGETTLQTGTGSNGFEFICPIMTQERLDAIGAEIFGEESAVRAYRPGKIKQLLGDPTLEIGDVVSLDYNGTFYTIPVMSLVIDYDGGLLSEIESFELTEPNSLSLSERLSFEQKQAQEKTGAYINSVVEFNQAIQKAYGVKNTTIGGVTYFHDTEKIEDAKYIYCMTANGIAFTDSWGGSHDKTVWKYGIDKDGEAFLNMLNVFHIKADLIEAGKLVSRDGKTFFDLDEGVIGTTDTELDENGDEKVVYSYKQTSEGVDLQTGKAMTYQEFTDSLSEERRAEIENEVKNKLGITGDVNDLPLLNQLAYHGLLAKLEIELWKKENKGFSVLCEDDKATYQIQFSGNKAFLSKLISGVALLQTEFSVDGIKSNQRLKFDAPGVDMPVTFLTTDDDCDQIFDDGVYIYTTDTVKNGLKNAPFQNAAVMMVFGAKSTTTQKIQLAFRYGLTGYCAFRPLFNNWLEWSYPQMQRDIESTEYPSCYYRIVDGVTEWINPPMIEGVEYRTTKRCDNKPVYVQKGIIGDLPNSSTTVFKISVANAVIDKMLTMEVELYNTNDNIRCMHPFIDDTGKIQTALYMTESARTWTLKTFTNMKAYTGTYYAEYTKA